MLSLRKEEGNMKYIRTKDDRIVLIPNNSKLVLYDDEKLVIDTTKKGQTCIYGIVKKKADTIEELCDEFVIIHKELNGNHTIHRAFWFAKDEFDSGNEVYGAIWTDKGLIYVAKMNIKGELELI